ncbi:hypothetical protein B0H13DRAFT_2036088 [Mycena leptocephala]|nr:hypothetical protein B0H13DRAFT_2036088 [Mycena leptocephala]
MAVTILESLNSYWRPLEGTVSFKNQLRAQHIPFVVHETLQHENRPLSHVTMYLKLCAFASPLHRQTYKILVYAHPHPNWFYAQKESLGAKVRRIIRLGRWNPAYTLQAVLLSYTLSLPSSPDSPCHWRRIAAVRYPDERKSSLPLLRRILSEPVGIGLESGRDDRDYRYTARTRGSGVPESAGRAGMGVWLG